MQFTKRAFVATSLLVMALCLAPFTPLARGQNRVEEQTDDILRIKTELVQTDVMVFDKQGRFVEGLRPAQFELSLDGKIQTLSFFERVTAGSSDEATQLAATRGNTTPKEERRNSASAQSMGRIIFFFLDDAHLGGASLTRAREALKRFVEEQMSPDDRVAIVSTSGQIGFLQQLTDNRAVLREAISRLNYKRNPEAYTGKTRISEYAASQIEDYGNRELFAYLMESTKMEQQMGAGNRKADHKLASTYSAGPLLKNRIRQVQAQTRMDTAATLDALRSLIHSSASIPGRKLFFFLSDGFVIDTRKADSAQMMRRVAQAAAQAGAVVYTMDLRGTFNDSAIDASTNDYPDFSSRRASLLFGEMTATQEPLRILADETGGRAILNSNSVGDGITQAIRETSEYYVLAWRPDSDEQRDAKARLKITIKDRPDLRVRLRSNFYATPFLARAARDKSNSPEREASPPATPEAEILTALGSSVPQSALPTSLSVGYVHLLDGTSLKISMQIEREAFRFDSEASAKNREVDVIGAAVDDRGLIYSFKQVLTVTPQSQSAQQPVVWNQQLRVKPGLYQVRVAVRERGSGRTGSAAEWVEIPDRAAGRFSLSSLFLGERKDEEVSGAKTAGPRPLMVNVDHKFSRASVLRFQTYVYNAARGANGTDVWVQAQVLRNNRQVLNTASGKVPETGDTARLPYWTEIPLSQLPPGRYVLQVSATDRVGNSSASQQVHFWIK
ncbi:MAG TPA: VWA domain-containing protein [Pyrinomonadaceae bacterium]